MCPARILLSQDSNTDGTFILQHIISLYLRAGGAVCVLGFEQTFGHYNNIASKLGLNLNQLRNDGRFIFVDGMKEVRECMLRNISTVKNAEGRDIFTTEQSMKGWYDLIHTAITPLLTESDRPLLMLIDNLSILLHLGAKSHELNLLQLYLYSLLQAHAGHKTLLVGMRGSADDDECQRLRLSMQHASSTTVHINQLSTGYSTDVHGQLSLYERSPTSTLPSERCWQYKITDKNVQFFPLGMSSAVI